MRMNERLYLTENRLKAVKEDDRSGRHLLCKKGAELDDKIAAKYSLIDGGLSTGKKAPSIVEIIPPEVKRTTKVTSKIGSTSKVSRKKGRKK